MSEARHAGFDPEPVSGIDAVPATWHPLVDLAALHAPLAAELAAAAVRVVDSGRYILGDEVAAFEAECAAHLGVRHAIGVSSGSDALLLALQALEPRPGAEVVTTGFSFVATASAVVRAGCVPRFADVRDDGCLDVHSVAARIGADTVAVVAVPLFGNPARLAELRALCDAHDVVLIEDAAQAFGARSGERPVGRFGHLAAFSFFPSKPLGGFGDGGLVATESDFWAERVRALRVHGATEPGRYEEVGGNHRLDALQAALLRVKLPHVDRWRQARAALVARWSEALADVADVVTPAPPAPGVEPAHAHYTVRVVGRRDQAQSALEAAGVATAVYYPRGLHQQPALATWDADVRLPVAERLATEVLTLPLSAAMDPSVIDLAADTLRRTLGRR